MNGLEYGVYMLNKRIIELKDQGERLSFSIEGRPSLRIHNFDPLVYDRYGLLRNKAPMVAGKVVLEALMTATTEGEEGGRVYLAARAGDEIYGFRMDDVNALNNVATTLGRPDLAVFQSTT